MTDDLPLRSDTGMLFTLALLMPTVLDIFQSFREFIELQLTRPSEKRSCRC